MDSPPPSPQPAIAVNNDDLVAGLSGITAFVIILFAVRIAHVCIARKSMQRNNYHSKRQWVASLSLNFLSISTGFFAVVAMILNIARFGFGSGNYDSDALEDALEVLFYFFYALQNLSYNFWLFARDRALQSTFFRTNVIIVYVAAIFSLVSAFCNFSLLSGFIEVETTFGQILGQVLQLLILCIMTALFTRPLLNYALGSWSQTNANIRAVVKRTAVGAVIHGTMSLAFIVLLLAADPIIEAIGFVDWYMLLNISVVVPLMIHISISHRDDKPVLSIVESFRSTSSAQNDVKSRSILQAYMSMAIETLKTESAEIQSSTNTSIDAIQPNPGVSSFTNSSELELSEDDARTSLPSEISVMSAAGPEDFTYVGDSSISSDQVAVTEIFDDTA